MTLLNRRNVLGAAICVAAAPVLAHAARPPSVAGRQQRLATIRRSEQFDLESAAGVTYVVRVAQPDVVLDETQMIRGRKPVAIYVLDGASHFGLVADIVRMMQGGGTLPPCLIVGVDYQDAVIAADPYGKHRGFDLTPTAHPRLVDAKQEYPGGGGAAFLSFLINDLKPLIASRFDIDQQTSVLMGHSYGGLFTISAVSQDKDAFTHYLSLSPSLWWDNRFELFRLRRSLEEGLRKPGRLAVFVGDREEQDGGLAASMVGNVTALRAILDAHPQAFASTHIEIMPNEDHFTLHGRAISRGLRFLQL